MFVVTLVLTIIGTIFVVLRLISRGLVVKKLTGADVLVFLAWVSSAWWNPRTQLMFEQVGACIASVAIMVATRYGLGKHDSDIDDEGRDTL